jgi:hypothetical protein
MLVLSMEGIYEVRCWDSFMLHAIDAKFQEKFIQALKQYWDFASEIREDVVLVLVMGGIYEVRRWDGLRCIHIKFRKYWV